MQDEIAQHEAQELATAIRISLAECDNVPESSSGPQRRADATKDDRDLVTASNRFAALSMDDIASDDQDVVPSSNDLPQPRSNTSMPSLSHTEEEEDSEVDSDYSHGESLNYHSEPDWRDVPPQNWPE